MLMFHEHQRTPATLTNNQNERRKKKRLLQTSRTLFIRTSKQQKREQRDSILGVCVCVRSRIDSFVRSHLKHLLSL